MSDPSALNDAVYDHDGDDNALPVRRDDEDHPLRLASQPLSRDFMVRLAAQVDQAVKRRAAGEDVTYGLSLGVVPGEQAGQLAPIVTLVLTMPGAIIGDRLNATHALGLEITGADQDVVDDLVGSVLESMRAHRSEQLSQR